MVGQDRASRSGDSLQAILKAEPAARGVEIAEAWRLTSLSICVPAFASSRERLHTVIAQAVLTGKRLDLEPRQGALRDTIRHTSQAVGLRRRRTGRLPALSDQSRGTEIREPCPTLAYPRMLAMYLARKHIGAAYSEIGRYFGDRNHSTVISAEKKVAELARAEERARFCPGFETVADLTG